MRQEEAKLAFDQAFNEFKQAPHMHTSESPPFYHLFDFTVLFAFAPKGLSSKFAARLLLCSVL